MATRREEPGGSYIYKQAMPRRKHNEQDFNNKSLHIKRADGAAESDA